MSRVLLRGLLAAAAVVGFAFALGYAPIPLAAVLIFVAFFVMRRSYLPRVPPSLPPAGQPPA